MSITKTNPITGYELSLMSGDGSFLGWIQLKNGATDAGYIYLQTPPETPRLGGQGGYVVMSLPPSMLDGLLTILNGQIPVQLRFFDPQSPNGTASAFLESRANQNTSKLSEEESQYVDGKLRHT